MSTLLNQERKQEKFHMGLEQKKEQPNVFKESGVKVVPAGHEVSDFMDGLDVQKPNEIVSEKISEDDKKQRGTGAKTLQGDDGKSDFSFLGVNSFFIPPQRIMLRRIRKELHNEIQVLMKQAKIEEKKGPYYLNEIMERIREVKGTLALLATSTYEFIKNLYITLFEKKNEIN